MPKQLKDSADHPGGSAGQRLVLLKDRLVSRRRVLVERAHALEHGREGDGDPAPADWSERAAQRSDDEVIEAIGDADAHELVAINAALQRLEQGTFGLCTRCFGLIAAERLRALPHVELCEKCALLSDAQHRATR